MNIFELINKIHQNSIREIEIYKMLPALLEQHLFVQSICQEHVSFKYSRTAIASSGGAPSCWDIITFSIALVIAGSRASSNNSRYISPLILPDIQDSPIHSNQRIPAQSFIFWVCWVCTSGMIGKL